MDWDLKIGRAAADATLGTRVEILSATNASYQAAMDAHFSLGYSGDPMQLNTHCASLPSITVRSPLETPFVLWHDEPPWR